MKFVHFEADPASGSLSENPAWHAWRQAGIGASDAATVAFQNGLLEPEHAATWQRDYAGLLAEKRGESREARTSWAMRRGQDLETGIRMWHEVTTGIITAPCFGEMDEHPVVRSSFDGVEIALDVLVEIKAANREVHQAVASGLVPHKYRPQVAHQALTAWGPPEAWDGARELHFVNHWNGETKMCVLSAADADFRRYAERLLPLLLAFWKEVEEGRAIPADVLSAARAIREMRMQMDEIEVALKDHQRTLTKYASGLGVPRFEVEGVRATETTRKGTVDYDRLFKTLGVKPTEEQVEACRKPTTTTWSVSVPGRKGGEG